MRSTWAGVCSLAAAIMWAQPAAADNETVETGKVPRWASVSEALPVPEDATGTVFVRRQDTQVHLDQEGQWTFSSSRYKLLHPNALQIGNISLTWNPASGPVRVHALKVFRDGRERDVLAEAEFEILRREDKLEEAMLTGLLTAVLRVPDLRVGDELEFTYSMRSQDPTLENNSFGVLLLAGEPAPGRFRLRLSWEEGQEPLTRLTPDFEPLAVDGDRSLQIDSDMPGPLTPPKDAPPRFGWQRILEYSDFATWQDVSRWFAPIYSDAARLGPDSGVREEAARIAAAHDGQAARADAALKLVQQQVRYIFVGLNAGALTPARAEETWSRRYGDCKGKTVLLLALLNELGIEAQAVLVNNSGGDDGLGDRLPSPGMFDHVLVRAKVDGQWLWLDGTLPAVATASAEPLFPYRWVLPLGADGAQLVQVERDAMTRPEELVLYEIDARDGFDQPARIVTTNISRGLPGVLEYMGYSAMPSEQLENAFRQQLEGSSTWDMIESVKWRYDVPSRSSILEISGTGPVDWDEGRFGSRSLTLPGGGFSPPPRRQRSSTQDQQAPFYSAFSFSCHATTVRLPRDTAEKDWSYNSTFASQLFGNSYSRQFERRNGAIRMIRASRRLQEELEPQAVQADNARIDDFDNSKAIIYYDPGSADGPGSGMSVPATYELDWARDSSACLPAGEETDDE